MRKLLFILTTLFISSTLFTVEAQAKRFGGGKSFGMQRSIQAPSRPATPQNPGMAPQAPARGMFGGMGGMLAGLAAGGLLGALLFGGAFDGIKPMDILIFAGIALAIFMVMRAMRRKQTPQPLAYAGGHPAPDYTPLGGGAEPVFSRNASVTKTLPQGTSEADFLHGAKAAFVRLQAAWDSQDLSDIRRFTTPEIYGEIAVQIEESEARNQTEVVTLEAQLLDAALEDDRYVASVRFDGLIKEGPQDTAQQVGEIWHFIKPVNSDNPVWYVAGIEQS